MSRVMAFAVSCLVVAAPLVFAEPGAVAEATSPVVSAAVANHQFLTANIGSGSECNPGHKSSYKCLHVVENQINANPRRFEAVSVDEACYSDYKKFKADYPRWSVFYTAAKADDPSKCGAGVSKGDFVASPSFTGAAKRFKLTDVPQPSSKVYPYRENMTCGHTSSTWFCTVHLPYLNSTKTAKYPKLHTYEIDEVWKDEESLSGNFVVAGDFNMTPGNAAFGRFHAHNFQETDPSNHATTNPEKSGATGVKFDYIWYHKHNESNVSISGHKIVSQPAPYRWTDPKTGKKQLTGYDHDILEGAVNW